jgi:hypothetical protein
VTTMAILLSISANEDNLDNFSLSILGFLVCIGLLANVRFGSKSDAIESV